MFEIFDTEIDSTKAPVDSNVRRILRKKNQVESLSIHAEFGEAWSRYADQLRETNISCLTVWDFGNDSDFSWLSEFCFIKKCRRFYSYFASSYEN